MAGPIDTILLRGLLADVALQPGATVAATVVARDGARGLLAMEGARVWATVPEGVEQGARLRLRVTEATPERVMLQVIPAPEHEAPAAPATAAHGAAWAGAVMLPGGAHARLIVARDAEPGDARGGAAVRSALVRYDSPSLGRLEMLVSPDGVAVSAAAGEPADEARAAAAELRAALRAVTGRAATVTVHDRTDTVDLHA